MVGIDLGEDKQALAVIDHDVRVLARKTVRVKAFRLGEALDWAAGQARAKGFARVTVACEPTGPRWMQVQRLCAERGLALVCVQPLVSHIAREQQDYTTHKPDESDCVLIARLAVELHCYSRRSWTRRGRSCGTWGGAARSWSPPRRRRCSGSGTSCRSAWPAVTETCAQPFKSVTWLAALQVVTSRCGGEPGAGWPPWARRRSPPWSAAAVPGWGGKRA